MNVNAQWPPPATPTPEAPAPRAGSVLGNYARFWGGRATYLSVARPSAAWFFPLWGLSLAVAYVCTVVVTLLVFAGGGEPPDNAVGEMVEQGSVLGLVLTAVILAPLIEEVAFRLPMSLRPWHVAGGIAVLSVMFVPSLFGSDLGADLAGSGGQGAAMFITFGLIVAITLGLGLILNRLLPDRSNGAPAEISPRVRYGVMLVLTLMFAAAHLSNFSEFTWFLPALIIPQLLVGMVLAYVRVTRSWWMAVGIHALNNAVAVGFGLMPRYAKSETAQGLAGLAILALIALLGLASAIALAIDAYRSWKAKQPEQPAQPPHYPQQQHFPTPPPWPPPGAAPLPLRYPETTAVGD